MTVTHAQEKFVQGHDSILLVKVVCTGAPKNLSTSQIERLYQMHSFDTVLETKVIPKFPIGLLFLETYERSVRYQRNVEGHQLKQVPLSTPVSKGYEVNSWIFLPLTLSILLARVNFGTRSSSSTWQKIQGGIVMFLFIFVLSATPMARFRDSDLADLNYIVLNMVSMTVLCMVIFYTIYYGKKLVKKKSTPRHLL